MLFVCDFTGPNGAAQLVRCHGVNVRAIVSSYEALSGACSSSAAAQPPPPPPSSSSGKEPGFLEETGVQGLPDYTDIRFSINTFETKKIEKEKGFPLYYTITTFCIYIYISMCVAVQIGTC